MNRPIRINTGDQKPFTMADLCSLTTPKVEVFPTVEDIPTARSRNVVPTLSRRSSFNQAKSASAFPNFHQDPRIDNVSPLKASTNSTTVTKSSTQLLESLKSTLSTRHQAEPSFMRINIENLETADAEEFDRELEAPSLAHLGGGRTPIASPCKKSMTMLGKANTSLARLSDEHTPMGSRNLSSKNNMQWDDVEVSFQPRDGFRKQSEIIPTKTTLPHYIPNILGRTKIYLLNDKIIDPVLSFLDSADLVNFSTLFFEFRNDKKYKSKFKRRLFALLLKGLNEGEQYGFWNTFMNFKHLKKERPTAFTQHFVRSCSFIKDIRKDVDRTFPELDKYSTEQGKASLLRVLVAVSNSIKELGYMQGLNYLAGVFLFYLKEEQAFWATLYLLEKLNAKDLLKENFETIHLLNYQFEVLLDNYLPAVSNHLNGQPVSVSYITTPWFITLYSYHMSLPKIVKLWNFYFLKGKAFLIQFGLAIFSIYQSSILKMDQDEVPIFLKNELRDISEYDDMIFGKALQFKVTNKMLQDIVPFYEQGKPKLIMQKDQKNKVRWQRSIPLYPSKSVTNLDSSFSRMTSSPLRQNKNNSQGYNTVIVGKGDETPSRMRALLNSVKQLDISDSIKNIFKRPAAAENHINQHTSASNMSRTEFSSSHNSPVIIKGSRMMNASHDHSHQTFTHSPATPQKDKSILIDYYNNRNVLKDNHLNIEEIEKNSPNLETQIEEPASESPLLSKRFEAMRRQQSVGKLRTTTTGQYSATNSFIGDFSPLEKGLRSPLTASTGKLPKFGLGNTPSQRLDERYMSIISLSKVEPTFDLMKGRVIDAEQTIELNLKNKMHLSSGSNSPDHRPKFYPRGPN